MLDRRIAPRRQTAELAARQVAPSVAGEQLEQAHVGHQHDLRNEQECGAQHSLPICNLHATCVTARSQIFACAGTHEAAQTLLQRHQRSIACIATITRTPCTRTGSDGPSIMERAKCLVKVANRRGTQRCKSNNVTQKQSSHKRQQL